MTSIVDLQVAYDGASTPSADDFQRWVDLVADKHELTGQEITIRVVDQPESQGLNSQYRGKDKPTNILSFPFEAPPEIEIDLLGDLVICADIVDQEAKQQNKALQDHWAHLTIHGTLHLLGYDHENEDDAQHMENVEVELLKKIGIDDPY